MLQPRSVIQNDFVLGSVRLPREIAQPVSPLPSGSDARVDSQDSRFLVLLVHSESGSQLFSDRAATRGISFLNPPGAPERAFPRRRMVLLKVGSRAATTAFHHKPSPSRPFQAGGGVVVWVKVVEQPLDCLWSISAAARRLGLRTGLSLQITQRHRLHGLSGLVRATGRVSLTESRR